MAQFNITDPDPTPPSGAKFTIGDAGEKPEAKPLNWSDVPGDAARNLIPSTARLVGDTASAVAHPIRTAEGLNNVIGGEVEIAETNWPLAAKVADAVLPGFDALSKANVGHEEYAKALNSYLADRYGSIDGIKRAIANDPAGVAADFSMVLSGGGDAAARLPGVIGKVGRIAKTIGKVTNPLTGVTKAAGVGAKLIGHTAADVVGPLATNTGTEALKIAADAGNKGGQAAKVFLDNMRGKVPLDRVVDSAKTAVQSMRDARNKAYRAGMSGVSKDKTVLDFKDIDSHMQSVADVSSYKGEELAPKTAAIRQEVKQIVEDWKTKTPGDFHTPEGMDALKKKLGDLFDATEPHTTSRTLVQNAYRAVRDTITKQAPEYARVMKDYHDADELIREIETTFSIKGDRVNIDTALRKLQSILRNNVNTNFGRRAELAEEFGKHGAPHLQTALAGQTLSPVLPRGLGRLGAGAPLLSYLLGHPYMAAAITPFLSPRVTGEAAYYAGKAAANAPKASNIGAAGLVSRGAGLLSGTTLNPAEQ